MPPIFRSGGAIGNRAMHLIKDISYQRSSGSLERKNDFTNDLKIDIMMLYPKFHAEALRCSRITISDKLSSLRTRRGSIYQLSLEISKI